MRRLFAVLACTLTLEAAAWGADGHSIIAELASRRLTPEARQEMERLLGAGVSLASISNWAEDVRDERPESYNWHFVNYPLAADRFNPATDCAASPKGDCIAAALRRFRETLTCPAGDAARREALRFVVHFIGDLHQPFHTVAEFRGGNDVKVEIEIRDGRCPKCTPRRTQGNLHQVWDHSLITLATSNWGAYVARLEDGWLKSPEGRGGDAGSVVDWMEASHREAARAWPWLAADKIVNDEYYRKALPVIDRQLALAGVRLARFLNETLPAKHAREKCS
jgi:hypothetical protein